MRIRPPSTARAIVAAGAIMAGVVVLGWSADASFQPSHVDAPTPADTIPARPGEVVETEVISPDLTPDDRKLVDSALASAEIIGEALKSGNAQLARLGVWETDEPRPRRLGVAAVLVFKDPVSLPTTYRGHTPLGEGEERSKGRDMDEAGRPLVQPFAPGQLDRIGVLQVYIDAASRSVYAVSRIA